VPLGFIVASVGASPDTNGPPLAAGTAEHLPACVTPSTQGAVLVLR
jgi:hypothetical protein